MDEIRALAEKIGQLRIELVAAQVDELASKDQLDTMLAILKSQIIADAGGAKSLGPNEAAQQMELTVRLNSPQYLEQWDELHTNWWQARTHAKMAKAQLEAKLDLWQYFTLTYQGANDETIYPI